MTNYFWETVGPKDDPTHILTVNGEKVAAVWFLGGHVERHDRWHITFRDAALKTSTGFESLGAAKIRAEEEHNVKPDPMDEVVMYLVARKDLKMSPGKLAAQVGHAVDYLRDRMTFDDRSWETQWVKQSRTKIVLAVNSEAELLELQQKLRDPFQKDQVDFRCVVVVDEGRTEVAGNSKTVLGVVPMPKSFAKQFIGHLPLYR